MADYNESFLKREERIVRKRQLERLIIKFSKQKGLPAIRLGEAQVTNREKFLRVDPRATPGNIRKLLA